MKSRQYTTKVLEIEIDSKNSSDIKDFFNKNAPLFSSHLIVIKGVISDEIREFLGSKSINFIENIELKQRKESKRESLLKDNLIVKDSIIRSGQVVDINGDLLILNRVNSGALVKVSGNLIITKLVEGTIECSGKFLMLAASNKSSITFNGVKVDNSYLKDKLNKIELIDDEIIITPILKKEINWA